MKKSIKNIIIPSVIIIIGIIYFVMGDDISHEFNLNKIILPGILLILEIIVCAIMKINKIIEKKECKYNRYTDNVVPPEIAEFIIDSKIGTKEMVMSILLNLKTRGNINFNDNKMILMNENELENYEVTLIESIFKGRREIQFNELRDRFIDSNKYTNELLRNIKNIKKTIENKVYEMGIYNVIIKYILDFVQGILLLISINLVIDIVDDYTLNDYKIFFFIIVLIYFISVKYFDKTIIDMLKQNDSHKNKSDRTNHVIMTLLLIIIVASSLIKNSMQSFELVIYLIDTIILFYLCNTKVFTKSGKQEYFKVEGLKKFLENYSLMKEREIQDIELWDKYMVYATAFNIPYKITDKMYENYMNTNIALQVLNEIFRLDNN